MGIGIAVCSMSGNDKAKILIHRQTTPGMLACHFRLKGARDSLLLARNRRLALLPVPERRDMLSAAQLKRLKQHRHRLSRRARGWWWQQWAARSLDEAGGPGMLVREHHLGCNVLSHVTLG